MEITLDSLCQIDLKIILKDFLIVAWRYIMEETKGASEILKIGKIGNIFTCKATTSSVMTKQKL